MKQGTSKILLSIILILGAFSISYTTAKASSSAPKFNFSSEELNDLQEGYADSSTKSQFKKYAKNIKSYRTNHKDFFHKKEISTKNTHPKKGNWKIYDSKGIEETFLTNLHTLNNQNIEGLQLYNTQYWTYSIDHASNTLIKGLENSDESTPLFNKPGTKIKSGDAIILLNLETDFKNTTDKTITYDGLSGYSGGDYDFTVDGKQYDRSDVMYTDETVSQEIQAGKKVEDKDMVICLSSGKTLKDAYKKIPNSKLNIKTAAITNSDGEMLGDPRTIELTLK